MEDSWLIRETMAGDDEAFRFIVLRYQRSVFRFLTTFQLPQAVIGELAQECFLRVYRNLGSWDPSKGASFSSWVLTIARNLALDEARRKQRRPETELSRSEASEGRSGEVAADPHERLERLEARRQLTRAIEKLPRPTILFVKRVVGLPGDRIEIRNNSLVVNGVPIQGDEVSDLGDDELNRTLTDKVAYSERGDEGDYTVLWDRGGVASPVDVTVPVGQVFVLGDNRGQSADSRDFGPVAMTDLVGTARQVWLSTGESGVRLGRIGAKLDPGG